MKLYFDGEPIEAAVGISSTYDWKVYPTTDMAVEDTLAKAASKITMVQDGEGEPSLENIRTIHGWQDIFVTHCSKNIFNQNAASKLENYNDFSTVSGAPDDGYGFLLPTKPSIVMTVSLFDRVYDSYPDRETFVYLGKVKDGAFVYEATLLHLTSDLDNYLESYTFTPESNAEYYLVMTDRDINDGVYTPYIQLEFGESSTVFEPYVGTTAVKHLDEVVYNGTYDWYTGVLAITDKMFELPVESMYNDNNYPGWDVPDLTDCFELRDNSKSSAHTNGKEGFYSNLPTASVEIHGPLKESDTTDTQKIYLRKDVYGLSSADWKSQYPGLVCQFVFPLLEPKIIQLDHKKFFAFANRNTFFSNCGDTKMTIRVDIKNYINSQIKAALG